MPGLREDISSAVETAADGLFGGKPPAWIVRPGKPEMILAPLMECSCIRLVMKCLMINHMVNYIAFRTNGQLAAGTGFAIVRLVGERVMGHACVVFASPPEDRDG